MAGVPPATARSALPATPAAALAAEPNAARPAAPSLPVATAPPGPPREDRVTGQWAGGGLCAALFVGAGLAIAFCPFLAPLFCIAGCAVGVDFMGDMFGFSPVRAMTGKSIGGWIASAFQPRPSQPDAQAGFSMRPQADQLHSRVAPPGDDVRRDALPLPEPVPTS